MGISDARLEDKMNSSETLPLTLWSRSSTSSDCSTYYSPRTNMHLCHVTNHSLIWISLRSLSRSCAIL